MILIVSLPQFAVALRVIISDIVVTYELSLCVLHTTLSGCCCVPPSIHWTGKLADGELQKTNE